MSEKIFWVDYGFFIIGTFHRLDTKCLTSISYRVWQNLLKFMGILIIWPFHLFIWLKDLHVPYFWRTIDTLTSMHRQIIYILALWFSFNLFESCYVDMRTYHSIADIYALDPYISCLSRHFNLKGFFWTWSNFWIETK